MRNLFRALVNTVHHYGFSKNLKTNIQKYILNIAVSEKGAASKMSQPYFFFVLLPYSKFCFRNYFWNFNVRIYKIVWNIQWSGMKNIRCLNVCVCTCARVIGKKWISYITRARIELSGWNGASLRGGCYPFIVVNLIEIGSVFNIL